MLLSITWLKDYLGKTDIKINPKDLAKKLTMRGLAVDAVRGASVTLESVVVGRIDVIEPHPNADKLQVTQVVISDEPDAEKHQIVCGAKNIEVGDYVPVALPGTLLPGNFKIKPAKLRGVESFGMLCSGTELEISEDGEGILQLPKHAKLGDPISSLLGSGDTILELDLTPNRGDCLSVIGLAREAAPLLKTKLRDPRPPRFKSSPHRTSSIVDVAVLDESACPRYVARVLDQLKVLPSPDWIKQRLSSIGIRPINNIVDVTNFVLYEYGQPLHAFDLRKIESGSIRVDRCKMNGQTIELLNGETVELQEGDILILDGEKPIALAGIMGGASTQVTDDTTSIILESATFEAAQIRKTAKRLGLQSDSSKRFEKGVDINNVLVASDRASGLLRDGFEANVYHPPIDTSPEPPKDEKIAVDLRDVRSAVGIPDLNADSAVSMLETIEIHGVKRSQNILTITLPTFRLDLRHSEDIVEEIARLIGYDQIEAKLPQSKTAYANIDNAEFLFEMRAKNILSGMGLNETIHFSFISRKVLEKYGAPVEHALDLKNPLSEELGTMRTSLLPSLLETYHYNKNRKQDRQHIFEVARVYFKDSESETGAIEDSMVAGLLSGAPTPDTWNQKPVPVDFFLAKGLVNQFLSQLIADPVTYEPLSDSPLFHPARSARLRVGEYSIGCVGEVHPFIRDQVLETKEPLVIFELNLSELLEHEKHDVQLQTPSKFPPVEFDLALIADKSVSSDQLMQTMKTAGSELLSSIDVFDVYEGENIPMGKRSLAFRLTLSARDRTLEESDIKKVREEVLAELETRHSARLR